MSFVACDGFTAFVGAGTMAFALAKGFTASKRVLASEIHMLVRSEAKRELAIENGYLAVQGPDEVRATPEARQFSSTASIGSVFRAGAS